MHEIIEYCVYSAETKTVGISYYRLKDYLSIIDSETSAFLPSTLKKNEVSSLPAKNLKFRYQRNCGMLQKK